MTDHYLTIHRIDDLPFAKEVRIFQRQQKHNSAIDNLKPTKGGRVFVKVEVLSEYLYAIYF